MTPTSNSPATPDVLVRVNGVGKKFCRDLKKSLWYGAMDVAAELVPFRSKSPGSADSLRPGEFWANKDISFELRRGECLGLIGHNGAGKTTLLKMLNGLIKPDAGTIEMRGRVGALIALGAGFNPILTGRENIYVNGSILGLSKSEISEKINDIIDFAEIREFIDSPVQSYSSGMQVRLGFAVATALNPDILILDEVLAVGDAAFRHKCYHRINKLINNCAVILVSHSMDQVGAIAKSVGLMHRGKFHLHSNPTEGILAYNEAMQANISAQIDGGGVFEIYPPVTSASVRILNPEIPYGGSLEVEISIVTTAPLDPLKVSFTAVNENEQSVMNWNLARSGSQVRLEAGHTLFRFSISPLLLHNGRYAWNLVMGEIGSIEPCVYAMRSGEFRVTSGFRPTGGIPYLPDSSRHELVRPASGTAQ